MNKIILPKVPSKLIRLALEDEDRVSQARDHFTINMAAWITASEDAKDGKCNLCLAGAIIANRIKGLDHYITNGTTIFDPLGAGFLRGNVPQLRAVDMLRTGGIRGAIIEVLRLKRPPKLLEEFTEYEWAFRVDVRQYPYYNNGFGKRMSPQQFSGRRRAWRNDMMKLADRLEAIDY